MPEIRFLPAPGLPNFATMQRYGNQQPLVPRQMRLRLCWCATLILALVGSMVFSVLVGRRVPSWARKDAGHGGGMCHPNLAHLRSPDASREVLLIGTVPLDLDGTSGKLVGDALRGLAPDVIMVEGSLNVGVNAMLLSGSWELHGMPKLPPPRSTNWSDIAEAEPVELRYEKQGGLRGMFGNRPQHAMPSRSLIPGKVMRWMRYLITSVGDDVKVAMATAVSTGVPLHFLGTPQDVTQDGFQGLMQVSMLAKQAAMELLEEEQQKGAEMSGPDVDAALQRAEGRIREESSKWLSDARKEYAKTLKVLDQKLPPEKLASWREHAEEHAETVASRISGTMETYRRAAVVVPANQLVQIERKLQDAGYEFVSSCV